MISRSLIFSKTDRMETYMSGKKSMKIGAKIMEIGSHLTKKSLINALWLMMVTKNQKILISILVTVILKD